MTKTEIITALILVNRIERQNPELCQLNYLFVDNMEKFHEAILVAYGIGGKDAMGFPKE